MVGDDVCTFVVQSDFLHLYKKHLTNVMESITIYPKSKKQKKLLKSLLEEMKVRFEISEPKDDTLMTEEEFYAKIDRSIQQAKEGNVKTMTREKQKELLGL